MTSVIGLGQSMASNGQSPGGAVEGCTHSSSANSHALVVELALVPPRSKMLKSIVGLKSANANAERSIARYNEEIRSGIVSDTIVGLSAMLEPDNAAFLHGPRPGAAHGVRHAWNRWPVSGSLMAVLLPSCRESVYW